MTKAQYGAVYVINQGSQGKCVKYDSQVSNKKGRQASSLLSEETMWGDEGYHGELISLRFRQGLVSNEKRGKSLPWTVMDTGSPMNIASAGDLEASQAVPATPLGSLRRCRIDICGVH